MRLGKVKINHGYIVDLDNEDMVQHAKDALYEDIMNADEVSSLIIVERDPNAEEGDIPEFLNPLKCKKCEEEFAEYDLNEDELCDECAE